MAHLLTVQSANVQNPWLVAGDFNAIAHATESSNYVNTQRANIKEFKECLNALGIFDHFFKGPIFTWSNRQDDTFIAKKLDRVLVSDSWHLHFAHSKVEFLPPEISDHCPMLVQLEKRYDSSPKPFKFFNYWTKHTSFLAAVKESWMEPMLGSPMEKLHRKLKRLKQRLKAFNKELFSDISVRVKAKRVELDRIQEEVLRQPRTDLVQLEKNLSKELYELMQAEEGHYKQKSRIKWLREGDANTNFFP